MIFIPDLFAVLKVQPFYEIFQKFNNFTIIVKKIYGKKVDLCKQVLFLIKNRKVLKNVNNNYSTFHKNQSFRIFNDESRNISYVEDANPYCSYQELKGFCLFGFFKNFN